MTLFAICPLGRRDDLPNVIRNWERQTIAHDCYLVVVENGDAVGACQEFGFRPRATLNSDSHPALAKNAGLEYAMENGATRWTTWDSDDWYGPRRLEEVQAVLDQHWVEGKSKSFVRLTDGRLILQRGHGANCYVDSVHGPTISSRIWGRMPFFDAEWMPDGSPAPGEDAAWCDSVKIAGRRIWASSCYHWCYVRRTDGRHVYQVDDRQLLGFAGIVAQARPAPPKRATRPFRYREHLTTLTPDVYLDHIGSTADLFECEVSSDDEADRVICKATSVVMRPIETPIVDLIDDNPMAINPEGITGEVTR